jgi:hypothetical protein
VLEILSAVMDAFQRLRKKFIYSSEVLFRKWVNLTPRSLCKSSGRFSRIVFQAWHWFYAQWHIRHFDLCARALILESEPSTNIILITTEIISSVCCNLGKLAVSSSTVREERLTLPAEKHDDLREALSWPRSATYVTIKSGCPSAVMLSACQQPTRNLLIAAHSFSSSLRIISLPRYVLTQ